MKEKIPILGYDHVKPLWVGSPVVKNVTYAEQRTTLVYVYFAVMSLLVNIVSVSTRRFLRLNRRLP